MVGSVVFVITQLVTALLWFCFAMYLIRRSKWEEIKANFTSLY